MYARASMVHRTSYQERVKEKAKESSRQGEKERGRYPTTSYTYEIIYYLEKGSYLVRALNRQGRSEVSTEKGRRKEGEQTWMEAQIER